MHRAPRHPNTQSHAERTLWRKIRSTLSAERRRKRKLYGLSSNREADLYIPRHFTPIAVNNVVIEMNEGSIHERLEASDLELFDMHEPSANVTYDHVMYGHMHQN